MRDTRDPLSPNRRRPRMTRSYPQAPRRTVCAAATILRTRLSEPDGPDDRGFRPGRSVLGRWRPRSGYARASREVVDQTLGGLEARGREAGDGFVQELHEAVQFDVGQGTVDPAVASGEVGGEIVRSGDGFVGASTAIAGSGAEFAGQAKPTPVLTSLPAGGRPTDPGPADRGMTGPKGPYWLLNARRAVHWLDRLPRVR